MSQLVPALRLIAGLLGEDVCYAHRGRLHFPLGDGWTVAISPESAGRLRVEACRSGRIMDRLWVRADDHERLAELVSELSDRISLAV